MHFIVLCIDRELKGREPPKKGRLRDRMREETTAIDSSSSLFSNKWRWGVGVHKLKAHLTHKQRHIYSKSKKR